MPGLVLFVGMAGGFLSGFLGARPAIAAPMVVSINDRPPYFYFEDNHAKGFLVETTKKILKKAGVEYQFVSKPPKRILADLEANQGSECSPGWFKTPEREVYAQYSDSIFQDIALLVAGSKAKAKQIQKHKTFASLTQDKAMVLGVIDGFSYGKELDVLINQMEGRVDRVASASAAVNIRKILSARLDYTLVNEAELDLLLKEAQGKRTDFFFRNFPDIPSGPHRYLICSKAVPRKTMNRINRAIRAVHLSNQPKR